MQKTLQKFNIMEKIVGVFEARRQFGKLLQDVQVNGDRFVVERNGEPVAAVVPMKVYKQWKRDREQFFASLQAAAERANLAEVEADALAAQAVGAARRV